MPATPSLRALAARARIVGARRIGRRDQRAEQRQAAHQLRLRDRQVLARRWCPSNGRRQCARAMPSRAQTAATASTSSARSTAARSTACERPLPGRSMRTTRWRASSAASAASRCCGCRPGRARTRRRRPRPRPRRPSCRSDASAIASRPSSKRFSIAPMPSISMRTTSPGCSHFGGLKPMPTPRGVPVAMTSPGSSVMPREQVSISVGDVEDHVAACWPSWRSSPFDPAAHARVAAVELVGGDDPRPHRAEGVEALAEVPLLVAHLHVARADVVDHRVAEHMVHRARLRDVAPAAADDHGELGTRSRSARVTAAPGRRTASCGPIDAFGELGEHDRPRRLPSARLSRNTVVASSAACAR